MPGLASAETLEREASETLTAFELNHGDELRFKLANGEHRSLRLRATAARVLHTNLEEVRQGRKGGFTLYEMTADVIIDGQPLLLRRYAPAQESFYEPLVINGLRVWFDGVGAVSTILNESHGPCFPSKDARFAVQDATLPIAPEQLRPWYPNAANRIDIRDCYAGDDVWMGPYFGADAHGGLDVNMRINTPLWAPFGIDDHWHFDSIRERSNNNRWRGVRRWPNGQRWVIQSHHQVELTGHEHQPLERGEHYAHAAGVWYGTDPHSHFVFKIGEPEDEILLDPWILFWEIFENNLRRSAAIRAEIAPLKPSQTGEALSFRDNSNPGVTGSGLRRSWSFGDGGFSADAAPTHAYARPGVYPVTLCVDDGAARDATTQWVTVGGDPIGRPTLSLHSSEPGMMVREPDQLDTYGDPAPSDHATIVIHGHKQLCPRPMRRSVFLRNLGGGVLPRVEVETEFALTSTDGFGGASPAWLDVEVQGKGNEQRLLLQADASRVRHRGDHGDYRALVRVHCPGAASAEQSFFVVLRHTPQVRGEVHREAVTETHRDPGFCATPYHWLRVGFRDRFREEFDWADGASRGWRLAADNEHADAYARFTPHLEGGRYRVSLPDATPVRPFGSTSDAATFSVRVRHAHGVEVREMDLARDRVVGSYEFPWGNYGFVEILSHRSSGCVLADAIVFTPQAG